MLKESEIITAFMAIGVVAFYILNRKGLHEAARPRLLFTAFAVMCVAWVLTVLEGLFLPVLLNYIEHICYLGSSILLLAWVYGIVSRREVAVS